jgi:hypothetical protein
MKPTKPHPRVYRLGYFLEPIKAGFPPGFVCSLDTEKPKVDMQAVALRARQTALDRGITGTIGSALSRKTSPGSANDVAKARITPAVISIARARQLGLKRYFTGQPCSAGHVAERYVSMGGCCECVRLGSVKARAAA